MRLLRRLGRYLNPLWRENHLLRTRLSPEACARMLRNQTEPWASPRALFDVSDRPLAGSISQRGFWLARRTGYVSPFRARISGRFEADGAGPGWTLVRARLAPH